MFVLLSMTWYGARRWNGSYARPGFPAVRRLYCRSHMDADDNKVAGGMWGRRGKWADDVWGADAGGANRCV